MYRHHLILLFAGALALVPCTSALYEDQVDKFDWRLQFVGRVKHILQPSSSIWQEHQSLIVSTHSNVLAGLYLRNGSIHWRHPLESDSNTADFNYLTSTFEGIHGFKCPVLSVNGHGRYIRCWMPDGLLVAEHNLPAEFFVELEKQSDSDYTFLYNAVQDPTTSEPQLLIVKLSYSTYIIEVFVYGLKTATFESVGRHQAGRWLSPQTSCQILGKTAASKALVCSSIDGLDLNILLLDPKNTAKQFKRVPLSSFGLKSDQPPRFLAIDALPYQSNEVEDKTTTLSKQSQPSGVLFAVNLGGDGFLLLSLSSDATVELVKVLPKATKLTVVPLINSEIASASGGPDSSLLEFGLAVLFTKEQTIPYSDSTKEGLNEERVFAAKLVVFSLKNFAEIASLSTEQILLEFGSKSSIAPITSSGKLVKRLDTRWAIDQFEMIPIRIAALNTRTGRSQHRYTYKMVLGTSDGTLILLNLSGKINWAREEALAEIIGSVMLDLPLSETDASLEQEYSLEKGKANILNSFITRICTQISQFSSWTRSLQHWMFHKSTHRNLNRQVESELDSSSGLFDPLEPGLSADDEGEDEEEDLVRDYFGIHKIIALRTRVGKLFAMDSLTGRIIWSKYEPTLRLIGDEPKFPIWVQRTSAHYPHSAICTFLTESIESSKESILYSFDPFTGKVIEFKKLPFAISQAMLIMSIHDAEFRRPILYLDTQYRAHLYPDTTTTRSLFKQSAANYYMLIANRSSNAVVGYSFAKSDASEGPKAQPVWSFQLPITGTPQILNLMVTFKRANEHVHSQGRVLGDRNVLYKYLNPNLVSIVWESIDSQEKPLITLYLLDAVNGNILHSVVHRRARGPIQIVHSENWVIYSYFNEKMRRNEISSIELYEGFEQVNATAFSSIGRDLLALPIVEQASFIFPTGIGLMTDTETQKGITNKHILISLPTGGLLELPRAFLDPRRPIKPTQEHAEEGLIPYVPELPIPSEALINYNKTIFGVRGIQTGPTSLESTSLVFAYGLDIFYARITPSKTFDILKDDFDFLLIAAVLIALITFSYLAKALAARKSLNAAWK